MQTLQAVLVDIPADVSTLPTARLLIEAEMNSAIDAGIRNIVCDLTELGVVEDHTWQPGGRQGNGLGSATEDVFEYGASRVT